MSTQRPRWSKQTKMVISLLLLAFFIFLLAQFSVIIPPLIIAIILAYILSPIARFLNRRVRIPMALAILLADLVLLLFLGTLPVILIPTLVSQFEGINLDIQQLLARIELFMNDQIIIGNQILDVSSLLESLVNTLQELLQPVIGQTIDIAVEIVSSFIWIVFILIVSFYLVKDYDDFRQWIDNHVPSIYHADYIKLRTEINNIWGAFFRGQLTLAFVVGVIITTMSFLIGLPFALAMGVLAGFLEFLPSIGHGIWFFLASILAFFIGSTWLPVPNWAFAMLVMGLHGLFMQFDLNYLIPRVIGRRVNLPPLVVILGIVTGAVAAGVLGIPLAAPTIASARVVGRYIFSQLFDIDPFPDSIAPSLPPPDPQWWRRLSLSKVSKESSANND